MRRMFWIAVGATAAVLIVRRVQRTADAMKPESIGAAAAGLGEALRLFAEEIRAGMSERELELRTALGLDGDPELPAGSARHSAAAPAATSQPPAASPNDHG
jgi:Family of unknown function (DUF6167)